MGLGSEPEELEPEELEPEELEPEELELVLELALVKNR